MKREKGFEVPFAVMRQIGTSMEDQLVSGFARVIRSGAYADGTTLPGIRKLAVMFGVGEITVRNAVKRLCRDGLLAARPRVGLTVCALGGHSSRQRSSARAELKRLYQSQRHSLCRITALRCGKRIKRRDRAIVAAR